MSELKTIRLYGKLGAKFGRVHRFAVANPAEAVQALCSQIPGIERYLTEAKDHGMGFAVFIGKRNLGESNLFDPPGSEDIRIAPMLLGAKSGWVQVLLGIVLIVVGAFVSVWGAPNLGASIMGMGISMVIGGVVQLLMPAPKGPNSLDSPDKNASYVFNGPVNTQAQGNPVPVLYGRMKVGSAVISAGIIANQQLAGTKQSYSNYDGGRFNDRDKYAEVLQ